MLAVLAAGMAALAGAVTTAARRAASTGPLADPRSSALSRPGSGSAVSASAPATRVVTDTMLFGISTIAVVPP